ncbi:hypothetical protein BDV19DRAFT_175745 [Aspergillus venezuelensis]
MLQLSLHALSDANLLREGYFDYLEAMLHGARSTRAFWLSSPCHIPWRCIYLALFEYRFAGVCSDGQPSLQLMKSYPISVIRYLG